MNIILYARSNYFLQVRKRIVTKMALLIVTLKCMPVLLIMYTYYLLDTINVIHNVKFSNVYFAFHGKEKFCMFSIFHKLKMLWKAVIRKYSTQRLSIKQILHDRPLGELFFSIIDEWLGHQVGTNYGIKLTFCGHERLFFHVILRNSCMRA